MRFCDKVNRLVKLSHSPPSPCLPVSAVIPSSPAIAAVKIGTQLFIAPVATRTLIITVTSTTLAARQERSKQLALAAARTAEDNRGEDIVMLDMRSMTT